MPVRRRRPCGRWASGRRAPPASSNAGPRHGRPRGPRRLCTSWVAKRSSSQAVAARSCDCFPKPSQSARADPPLLGDPFLDVELEELVLRPVVAVDSVCPRSGPWARSSPSAPGSSAPPRRWTNISTMPLAMGEAGRLLPNCTACRPSSPVPRSAALRGARRCGSGAACDLTDAAADDLTRSAPGRRGTVECRTLHQPEDIERVAPGGSRPPPPPMGPHRGHDHATERWWSPRHRRTPARPATLRALPRNARTPAASPTRSHRDDTLSPPRTLLTA